MCCALKKKHLWVDCFVYTLAYGLPPGSQLPRQPSSQLYRYRGNCVSASGLSCSYDNDGKKRRRRHRSVMVTTPRVFFLILHRGQMSLSSHRNSHGNPPSNQQPPSISLHLCQAPSEQITHSSDGSQSHPVITHPPLDQAPSGHTSPSFLFTV